VCLPILIVTAMGWTADRKFQMDLHTVIKLNIYLFVPGSIFARVYSSEIGGALAGRVAAFTLTMAALMYVASLIASRLSKASPERGRGALQCLRIVGQKAFAAARQTRPTKNFATAISPNKMPPAGLARLLKQPPPLG